MIKIIRFSLACLALCLQFSIAEARDLVLEHKGINITANLVMAAGKTMSDPIVVMTHGTLAHNKMEIMSQLQDLFKENDMSSLSINLGLGISDRQGMYDCKTTHTHKHTDAIDEIGVWVNWLKHKGAKKIILLGHSRGGNQTAWYAAEHPDDVINKVILIAPATWSESYAVHEYQERYKKDLNKILAQAESLVKQGEGKTVMKHIDHIYCADTSVTAESFVSYYKPDQRFNTPSILSSIKAPVLVFAGSEDKVVKDLEKKVKPFVRKGRLDLVVIEGAGHMFRDLYAEDMMDQIVEYLAN